MSWSKNSSSMLELFNISLLDVKVDVGLVHSLQTRPVKRNVLSDKNILIVLQTLWLRIVDVTNESISIWEQERFILQFLQFLQFLRTCAFVGLVDFVF